MTIIWKNNKKTFSVRKKNIIALPEHLFGAPENFVAMMDNIFGAPEGNPNELFPDKIFLKLFGNPV